MNPIPAIAIPCILLPSAALVFTFASSRLAPLREQLARNVRPQCPLAIIKWCCSFLRLTNNGKTSYAAIGVALALTVLITLLFMRMLVAKDKYAIAVMKAFGFTNTDIKAQNVARSVFVLSLGDLVGWLEGKREILSVWETVPEMKAGNAVLRQVYRVGDVEFGRLSRQRQ